MRSHVFAAVLFALVALPVGAVTPAISKSDHTLALDAAGNVYAWGRDGYGELGHGRTILRTSPTLVPGLPTIVHFSLASHALAADSSGHVWSWSGNNASGQLGPREQATLTKPARVTGVGGVVKVAAASGFSLALKSDGTVWAWGSLPWELGQVSAPKQLAGLANITDISAEVSNHALALRGDGVVFAFGGAGDALGLGPGTTSTPPTAIPGLSGVVKIRAEWASSMAVLSNGEIRAWGLLGFGGSASSPQALPSIGGTVASISCGGYIGININAVRGDGKVLTYSSSANAWGESSPMSGLAQYTQDLLPITPRFAEFGILTNGQVVASGFNNNRGQLGQGDTAPHGGVVTVPGLIATRIRAFDSAVMALATDGKLWAWGGNDLGQHGDGAPTETSVPLAVPISATIKAIVASRATGGSSYALDTTGKVWAWGFGSFCQFGPGCVDRSTPALVPGAVNVLAIAADEWYAVYLMGDGTVSISGQFRGHNTQGALEALAGFANIVAIATSGRTIYGLRGDGVLLAVGDNAYGELGNGTTTPSDVPVAVQGITGSITRIAAVNARAAAVTSNGKVWTWGALASGGGIASTTAVQRAGITDAVDIAIGLHGSIALRQGGSLVGWDQVTGYLELGVGIPAPGTLVDIPFHEPVRAVGVGSFSVHIVGASGVTWGYGPHIADGTYAIRREIAPVLRAGGEGSLETNDWYLDLDAGVADVMPPAKVPRALAVARRFGVEGNLGLEATIKYLPSDVGKAVGHYILGLVPPSFLQQVAAAPGTSPSGELKSLAAKSGGYVLVQLTPQGWTDAKGQLIAQWQGTANAAGGASSILAGVNVSQLLGARFCVGYGESADSLLSAGALREVLTIDGATSTSSGVPCVLSGVYVGGPATSVQNSPVTFTASVVGLTPTGVVQFRDSADALGSPAALSARNPAVSVASLNTLSLPLGVHSIGAVYSGDALNPPAAALTRKLHEVKAPAAQTRVEIAGPVSSQRGGEVTFVATVTGNQPSGGLRFRDGGTDLDPAVPVVDGIATLRTSTLAVGTHSLTAAYSGDGANLPGTSPALSHQVADVIAATVSLSATANPSPFGSTVGIVVIVSGASPTGSVTLREGASTLAGRALSSGSAGFSLQGLAAGLHTISADYSGDGNHAPASSRALFLDVSLPVVSVQATASKTGFGTGKVASNPAGIDCGATCSTTFLSSSTVTFTATPDPGSVFVGWSGACAGSGACTVAMSVARGVSARFDIAGVNVSIAPAALSFGGQSLNTTAPTQTVTLTNNSGASITVTAVNAPAAFVAGTGCAVVNPGASCPLFVNFTPATESDFTANVAVLYTQAAETRSSLLRVTGTGERSLVTHYYRSILRRAPDAPGKAYWASEAARLQSIGANINETWFAMSAFFYSSAEYASFNRDNAGFVTDLYNTFFNRTPDGPGLAFWTDLIASGMPREVVLTSFMFSTEFVAFTQAIFGNTAARAEVDMVFDFYRGLLARLPDATGFADWRGSFRAAQCAANPTASVYGAVENISKGFIASGEYTNRNRNNSQYVGDLYNAALRRGGDLNGVQFWINKLDTAAMTREQVRQQFIASGEFTGRVTNVIGQGCLP